MKYTFSTIIDRLRNPDITWGLIQDSLTDKRTASMDCEIELGVTEQELSLFPEITQKKIPFLLDLKIYPTPSLVHATRRESNEGKKDQKQERQNTYPNGIRRIRQRDRETWNQK